MITNPLASSGAAVPDHTQPSPLAEAHENFQLAPGIAAALTRCFDLLLAELIAHAEAVAENGYFFDAPEARS